MKKTLSFILCLSLLLCFSACGKKEDKPVTDPVVVTDEADKAKDAEKENNVEEDIDSPANNDDAEPEASEEAEVELSEEETETYVDHKTAKEELRSEKEETEINNNLTDIAELIDLGAYDDALMMIEAMKTRKLSENEYEILLSMEDQIAELSAEE